MQTFREKKIMDRIELIEPEDLPKYIDKTVLAAEYGGHIPFNIDSLADWIDRVIEINLEPGIPVTARYIPDSNKVPTIILPPRSSDEDKLEEKVKPKSARDLKHSKKEKNKSKIIQSDNDAQGDEESETEAEAAPEKKGKHKKRRFSS